MGLPQNAEEALIVDQQDKSTTTTILSASVSGVGTAYSVGKYKRVAFTGYFGVSANHVTIDGSVDNTTWAAITSTASALSGTFFSTTNHPLYIRANVRTYSSDTPIVKMNGFTV